MKIFEEIVDELAQQLETFGLSDDSKKVIALAVSENKWFAPEMIISAVQSIATEMLDCHKVREWLETYPSLPCSSARSVAIIMAGNIPLVGFFDLFCTLAAGHRAFVKSSSKDRVLMNYICDLLRATEPSTPIYIYDEELTYDAIIATGGTSANRYFESHFASSVKLLRSSRHSVAVLSGRESHEELQLLSSDIYAYNGLGCRNISMIFTPKGHSTEIIAPTNISPKYRNNYLQTKALLTLRGTKFEDNGASVIVRSSTIPSTLSTIAIWEYDSIEEVEEWIAQNDNMIQCIESRIIDHPRAVGFGESQRPTLFDYADGVDTMKFLEFNS